MCCIISAIRLTAQAGFGMRMQVSISKLLQLAALGHHKVLFWLFRGVDASFSSSDQNKQARWVLFGREKGGQFFIVVSSMKSFCFHILLFMQVYFDYLQHLFQMLQRLPEASRSLKNTMEEEWQFAKEICPHTKGLEAQAGRRFW